LKREIKIENRAYTSAVIFGGRGREREISRRSARAFLSEASRLRRDVLCVYISERGDFFLYIGEPSEIAPCVEPSGESLIPTYPVRLFGKSGFLIGNEVIPVDRAFILLHGDFGEDGRIQGAIETAGIPIVGADTLCGALCADKAYSKAVAERCGINTVPWVLLRSADSIDESVKLCESEIGYPAFIKPASLGSSIGAAAVRDRGELISALRAAFLLSERVLCENCIEQKRELECAYLSHRGRSVITHPGEILTDGFYDYSAKYEKGTEVSAEADIPKDIREKIMKMTELLVRELSVRHMARFDYFLLPSGEIYFNEVNTCPGLTEGSLYPRLLGNFGVPFGDFVSAVLGGEVW
jgi:D-alanine--D-alanine ligase